MSLIIKKITIKIVEKEALVKLKIIFKRYLNTPKILKYKRALK